MKGQHFRYNDSEPQTLGHFVEVAIKNLKTREAARG